MAQRSASGSPGGSKTSARRRRSYGGSTRENYRWALDQTSTISTIKLRDLKAADVNRMLGHLATRKPAKPGSRGGRRGPLGESALRRVRFALGVVLDAAMADGRLTVNVAQPKLARIPRSATQVRPRRSLTVEEAESTVVGGRGPQTPCPDRHDALLRAATRRGQRDLRGTASTSRRRSPSRQSRKIAPDGTMTIGGTKANSDRTIRLPDEVVTLLVEHKKRQKPERLAARVWEHEDLVFTNAIGDYIDPSNLRREVAGLCEDAGISPTISPNELRHSCASLLRHLGYP